ncbi:MAG: hypothetical protein FJ006_12840 [Chloroflexi bacterium]|nr:hypothetical protein [Chloroflexota bacterium]
MKTKDASTASSGVGLLSVRECLSEYAHEAWSGWMKYMFEKSAMNKDGTVTLPKWAVDRWTRQMNLSYADLPEEEKESDRTEADRMLSIFNR